MAKYKLTQKTDANGTIQDIVLDASCVDGVVKSVNGTAPDANGNVNTSSGGDLSNYVDLISAQTISGQKTFTSNILSKNENNAYTDNPASPSTKYLTFVDKNNTTIGDISSVIGNGWNALNLELKNKSNENRMIEFVHYPSSNSWNFDCTTDNSVNLGTASRRWKSAFVSDRYWILHDTSTWEGIEFKNSHYTRGQAISSATSYLGTMKWTDKDGTWMGNISCGANTSTQNYLYLEARQATTSGGSTLDTASFQVRVGNGNSAGHRFLQCRGNLFPQENNTYQLGLQNYRWSKLWLNGTISNNTYTWTLPNYTGTLGVIDKNTISATYIGDITSSVSLTSVITANGTYMLIPNGTSSYGALYNNGSVAIYFNHPLIVIYNGSSFSFSYTTTNVASVGSQSLPKANVTAYSCKVYKI